MVLAAVSGRVSEVGDINGHQSITSSAGERLNVKWAAGCFLNSYVRILRVGFCCRGGGGGAGGGL